MLDLADTCVVTSGNRAGNCLRSARLGLRAQPSCILGTWLRGEVDPDDAFHAWNLRIKFFNAQGQNLGYQDAVTSHWVSPEWTYVEGRGTAPAGAVEAEVMLFPLLMSGWVTFDNGRRYSAWPAHLRCRQPGGRGWGGDGRGPDPLA